MREREREREKRVGGGEWCKLMLVKVDVHVSEYEEWAWLELASLTQQN